MSVMFLTNKTETYNSAAPSISYGKLVAKGAKNKQAKNRTPIVREVIPVVPPTETPKKRMSIDEEIAALRGLQAQYNDSVGYENNMIQGKPAQAVNGYRSQAEVVRDMNAPRYDRDPAFRQEVMDKLANSPGLNF